MGQCSMQLPRHNAFCLLEDSGNHKNFGFESYGPHSRCIMADRGNNNFQAACVRSRCSKDGKYEIQIGSDVFTCPREGTFKVELPGYNGQIECPSAQEMCKENLAKRCPLDCHGHGVCMNDGKCQCLHGFSGPDCNNGQPKESDPFVTDFDIRKKNENEGENPDDREEEEEDSEEEENEEEDSDDEEEDEEQDEEDREEEEEREREEEKPLTEKAKELIAEIERKHGFIDFWQNRIRMRSYQLKRAGACEVACPRPRRRAACERRRQNIERGIDIAKSRVARFQGQADALEAKLAPELTDRQAQERAADQEAQTTDRKVAVLDKFIAFLEARLAKDKQRFDFWTSIVKRMKELVARFPKWRCLVRRLERFEQILSYWTEMVEITTEALEAARAEGDTLLGIKLVEAPMEVEESSEAPGFNGAVAAPISTTSIPLSVVGQ